MSSSSVSFRNASTSSSIAAQSTDCPANAPAGGGSSSSSSCEIAPCLVTWIAPCDDSVGSSAAGTDSVSIDALSIRLENASGSNSVGGNDGDDEAALGTEEPARISAASNTLSISTYGSSG